MAAARAWWRRFFVDEREGRARGRHSPESPEWHDQTELGDVRSWPTERRERSSWPRRVAWAEKLARRVEGSPKITR